MTYRDPLAPGDSRHGTVTGYVNHRCRCADCREAWARWQRGRRMTNLLMPDDTRHGTVNGYINYQCRCSKCTTAQAEYMRKYRQQRRATDVPEKGAS